MGLDFIRARGRTFKKSWSAGASELSTPSLFTRHPECQSRSINASVDAFIGAAAGTCLTVSVEGEQLALVHETRRVGVVTSPPADLLSAIRDSGGCALGEIKRLNPISGTVDVEIQ